MLPCTWNQCFMGADQFITFITRDRNETWNEVDLNYGITDEMEFDLRSCNRNSEAMFFRDKICNCLNYGYNCNDHISIWSVFPQFKPTSFHVLFLSRVKMNSINWSAPNIWVFIVQLVKHCSANAEVMGSNPVEALKWFFEPKFAMAKLQLQLRWSHLHFIGYHAR